jgi:hypothetical protein
MALRRLAKPLFAIWSSIAIGGSLWFFHRELAATHFAAIERSLGAIPLERTRSLRSRSDALGRGPRSGE